jgi:hypothetical protein
MGIDRYIFQWGHNPALHNPNASKPMPLNRRLRNGENVSNSNEMKCHWKFIIVGIVYV